MKRRLHYAYSNPAIIHRTMSVTHLKILPRSRLLNQNVVSTGKTEINVSLCVRVVRPRPQHEEHQNTQESPEDGSTQDGSGVSGMEW